jgi:hypothetical protein
MVARESVEKGSFKFTPNGSVVMDLVHPESETTATGKYVVEGTAIAMTDLRSSGDSSEQIKTGINMNLAWTGNDNVIAMDKTEAIFLKRHKTGNPLTRFLQMDLKKDQTPVVGDDSKDTRGVIGYTKRAGADTADN